MAHPIHQANENSPYGDLTREEFYKKHHILHEQSFMLNQQNMKIFTQSWRPNLAPRLRGLVAMVHGYNSESSWLFELNAVAIAKAGFYVCALDLQGHGCSDGSPGHIPNIRPVVEDCIEFFDSARADHPKLPAFIYGESLGGAIATLICLKQRYQWDGLVLNGAMCGVSKKFKPAWPLEKLLPVAALFAPNWRIVISKPVASKSYKEEWKRRLVAKSPSRRTGGKPPAATALEFMRVCEYIKRNCHGLEVPMLVVHGGDDTVCDPNSARFVHESAASKDKSVKIFSGMWHQLIGEPNESVELVFGTVLSWIGERADKAKTNSCPLMPSLDLEYAILTK
ncbi:caffeoylshikimate esterase-like [Cornus florida]|uniref:caffeoylshikimate esterase-like n=1 Tax=Cornus florida TaxID=4283 RepID=UPI0028A0EEDF|nr:caffeoylshikimate esterase-like [Cornus florida]